jgi:hypothetical protein
MLFEQSWIKVRLNCLLVALFSLAIVSCSKLTPVSSGSDDEAAIVASIDMSQTGLSASAISSILMQVSGAGMDTVRKQLTLDGTKATLQLKVKAGKSRTFSAIAYQGTLAVLRGTTTIDLVAGKSTNVPISMEFSIAAVILSPPDTTVAKDASFTLYLKARHVTDLCTFGARISFDKTRLKVLDLGREDAFLKSGDGSINQLRFTKDTTTTTGKIDIVLGVFPASKAVSGEEGMIGRIVFKALTAGTADLNISLDSTADSDLGLYDKNANLIPSIALGSRITVQ